MILFFGRQNMDYFRRLFDEFGRLFGSGRRLDRVDESHMVSQQLGVFGLGRFVIRFVLSYRCKVAITIGKRDFVTGIIFTRKSYRYVPMT